MSAPASATLSPAALFDLSGRVALVTGASRGIGFQFAATLAAAGAHVVLNARDASAVEARVVELLAAGFAAETMAFDVADAAAATHAVADIAARHGRLDILFSNAGGSVRKPLLELGDDDWQAVIGAHLTAGFRLAREAARVMLPRKFGRIVFTASINSFIARPTITPYVAAKTGMLGLVRGLAVELAPHGITVNAIAPGYFPTEGNAPIRAASADFAARIAARTPAGRWGELGELATAALLFASPASSYTTGTVLTVDGAMTAAI
ncbi:MAG: SDR family oxidoreductase [Acetobacteraceae bacterium]|nr:SDR family oxidoreductase [Acetobacteraceae bacterium]